MQGIAPVNGGAYLKWAPTTRSLRGFSANIGVTHVGPTPSEAPNAGDVYTTTRTGERILSRTTYQ